MSDIPLVIFLALLGLMVAFAVRLDVRRREGARSRVAEGKRGPSSGSLPADV